MATDPESVENPEFHLEYYRVDTRVFWDVEDFPVPENCDLARLEYGIKQSLKYEGYIGDVSIYAYIGLNTSEKEIDIIRGAGITLANFEGRDKQTRLNSMLVNMLEWIFETPGSRPNLMVISKDMPQKPTEFTSVRQSLIQKGINVFVAVADEADLPPRTTATTVWSWINLYHGEFPFDDDSDSESDCDCEEERSVVPKAGDGKTRVFWDLEDFPVPENLTIREIVDSVLGGSLGYKGEVSINAYGESEKNLYPVDGDGEFTYVCKRDKYWRLSKMLTDIGLWAVDNPEPFLVPTFIMVVAKNIDQQTEFVNFLQYLSSSSYRTLLVVPDVDDCQAPLPFPFVTKAWRWKNLISGGDPMSRAEFVALIDQGNN